MTDRRIALAALDPNAAIAALQAVPPTPAAEPNQPLALAVVDDAAPAAPVLSVEVQRPVSRFRFLVFWLLLKLACRVYPFRFEIRVPGGE